METLRNEAQNIQYRRKTMIKINYKRHGNHI